MIKLAIAIGFLAAVGIVVFIIMLLAHFFSNKKNSKENPGQNAGIF
jgi:hypothetical protein